MSKAWNLWKPVIIIILCILGYAQDAIFGKDISGVIFIAITAMYFILHGKQVMDAIRSIGGGGVSQPTGKSIGGGGVSEPTKKKNGKK